MLKLSSKGVLEKIAPKKRQVGDVMRRAVELKLVFDDVAVSVASAFVGQLALMFGDDDDPLIPEVGELSLARDINNVDVEIEGVKLVGCDIVKATIALKPKCKCSIKMQVNAVVGDVLDKLHHELGEKVRVKMVEKQPQITKLEGGVAGEEKIDAALQRHAHDAERAPAPH